MSTQTLSRGTKSLKNKSFKTSAATAKEVIVNRSSNSFLDHSVKAHSKSKAPSTKKTPPLKQWLGMSRSELDLIYKQAKPGNIPQGDTFGTAILAGGPLPRLFANAAKILAWQGKVFDLFPPNYNSGVVVNKVSPLGLKLIVAKTYLGESWMDGKETIIIDYSSTSLLASPIRDEMREVKPGLYLGKVWWGKTRILDFALETYEVAIR